MTGERDLHCISLGLMAHGVQLETTPANDANMALCKGFFVQGLTEARNRNPNTDLSKYIEAYILVQVNVMFDLLYRLLALTSF